MGYTLRRMALAGTAVAVLAGVVWMVIAAGPSNAPPAADATSAPLATMSDSMPKAIATAHRPAIVKIAPPAGSTRGLRAAATSLQITVRPEAVERGEPYLVNVYAVPAEKAGAAPSAKEEDTLVGSFSFFPPPRAGEARTFALPTPSDAASMGPDITLKVELVPAAPDAKLEKSTLAVIDARIATE